MIFAQYYIRTYVYKLNSKLTLKKTVIVDVPNNIQDSDNIY